MSLREFEQQLKILKESESHERNLRIQSEDKLQRLEKEFRATVEMQTDLICRCTLEGTLLYVNQAYCEFFGEHPQNLVGKSFAPLIPEEDRDKSLKNVAAVSATNLILRNQHRVINGKGEIRWMEWINRGILDNNGKLVEILANGRDITERMLLEKESKQLLEKTLELNELKSNILTFTSHELKTPLTAILGWAEFLLAQKSEGKDLNKVVDQEILSSMVRNANRLNALIDAYLDVGRIDNNRLQLNPIPIDIRNILENSIQMIKPLAIEKIININITTFTQIINVDPVRVEQVLTNVLSNAIKYSPERTNITIKTELKYADSNQKNLVIMIADEGYGFTPEELKVAFDPFSNISNPRKEMKHTKGTGLGLFICKNIIEKHGGTFSIFSDGPNKGSTVTISIPISPI